MAGYLGATPVPQATQHRESFTATSGQTTFATAGYTAGFVDVYLNGSHLSPADFTATNGSDVVLASGASADDVCDIISHSAFELNAQTFTGGLTADTATLSGTAPILTITDTDNTITAQIGSGTSDFNIATTTAHNIDIRTNNTRRLVVESDGDISFYEDTGSTAKFFWDASAESLGIGTSSPAALMHINGGSTAADGIHYIATNTSSGPAGIVMNSGHGNWKIMNSQTVANALEFIDGGSPDVTKMMIDSGGNVLFNTTAVPSASSGGAAFDPNSNGRAVLKLATTNTGNQGLAEFFNPNGQVGGIVTNGSATAYNTSSDYRLKENVDYDWDATTRLKQLKPARFNFIADADTTVDGFLAHEAQAVVPECVSGTKDAMKDEEYEVTPAVLDENGTETTAAVTGTRSVPDMQGIDQSKIVPLLVKTILELEARITGLENA